MAMAFQANHSIFSHPCSNSAYPILLLQPRTYSSNSSVKIIKVGAHCSHHTNQVQAAPTRIKKKLKPSFFEEIRHKWSLKTSSPREKLPWQQGEEEQEKEDEQEEDQEQKLELEESKSQQAQIMVNDQETDMKSPVNFASPSRFVSAPWVPVSNWKETQFNFQPEVSQIRTQNEENADRWIADGKTTIADGIFKQVKSSNTEVKPQDEIKMDYETTDSSPIVANSRRFDSLRQKKKRNNEDSGGTNRLPWRKETHSDEGDGNRKSSHTTLAERTLPEHKLKRLRNVSLRMLERIKVGATGISQALLDSIHEKWKVDEVVKLKFEKPHSLNMRRTHEILEHRTGGLVIWRSGSSIVLFRGMSYKFQCVKSFTEQSQMQNSENVTSDVDHNVGENSMVKAIKSFTPDSPNLRNLSEEELVDLSELNYLLDELGPRFTDWCGCEPLPVDADLLPPVVPGYKTPFRLLPYGVRHCLRDSETTNFRRLARKTPPHFALGRSRELQGLAKAMVKLWEKSAIAKIAIKRGVLNTRNERMAEELKRLTGGTLLSRNKDFIVFYRGNDFLPPVVTEKLKERLKVTDIWQDEEERARQLALALTESKPKASRGPLVAGTLAETVAASSRWGNQPSAKDVEEMMRDSTVARHASLVQHLEKKLTLAKGKLKRAEFALAKLQKSLEPAGLPSDLETITDEERFLFRKIGLSMKPYLLLGRRGVYDGTIENMHLHWKYRELVKIIVKGKSFPQVKHIAISLEAESGGVLVSLDKTVKGYAIIVYRGKNYVRPSKLKPENLLTKRQALARSVELQRREALKHHVLDLEERIELVKSQMEEIKAGKNIDVEESWYSRLKNAYFSDDDGTNEDKEEEVHHETRSSYTQNEL